MTFDVRDDVEDAFARAVPEIRRHLAACEVSVAGTDEELATLLAEAVVGCAGHAPATVRPLDRHERCEDCDAMAAIHLDGYDHCTVCDEVWPCEHAGEVDGEQVERIRASIAAIDAKDVPTVSEIRRRRQYIARLEREGIAV